MNIRFIYIYIYTHANVYQYGVSEIFLFFLKDLCADVAEPGQLIAHPANRGQFVICYGPGEFTVMDCPEHLIYNSHTERCDTHLLKPEGCLSNPCMNGGICIDLPKLEFRCQCPKGFIGDMCERVDMCASKPCGTEGVCQLLEKESPLGFICNCKGKRLDLLLLRDFYKKGWTR